MLLLPCEDLGGRQIPFEAAEIPLASLPNLRHAWAYIRGRGMVNPDGRHRVPANVMLRHRCDPTSVRQLAAGGTHRGNSPGVGWAAGQP